MKERFIIKQSKELPNHWVCTDTKYNLVCKFEEGLFNSTQEIIELDDATHEANELATAVREMADWLNTNYNDLVFRNYRDFIANRIKELRAKQGLSQEELASLSGLNRPNIARIEGGKYNMTIDTLGNIADALNCKIDLIE